MPLPTNSTPPTFGTRRSRFTAPTMPDVSTLVPVILLQRKGTSADGSTDPRQLASKKDGTVRQAVLMNLVAVSVEIEGQKVYFPDVTEQFKMPAPGTPELKELLAKPSGLFVEALFKPDLDRLRADLVAGHIDMNFTVQALDAAIAENKLNSILPPMATLKALGYVTKQSWTIADVMFGQKTINVQLLSEDLGDAYADGFDKLRKRFGFPNVAFKCYIDPILTVTELSSGFSYSVTVYFMWANNELDPAFALSGKPFSTPYSVGKQIEWKQLSPVAPTRRPL
jgi:hypothetical protein